MPAPFILAVWLVLFHPADGGKVIIKTDLQGVEFYLDGNFVAKTESDGALRIESFPAGSFRYSLRKKGYVSQEGSFSMAEGETRTIEVKLKPLANPERPKAPSGRAQTELAAARSKPASEITSAKARSESIEPGMPSSPAPATVAGGQTKATEDDSLSGIWIISGLMLAGAGAAFLFWRIQKRRVPITSEMDPLALLSPFPEPPPEPAPEPADPTQVPDFIHKLKRREELMKAGFVDPRSREVEPAEGKEREIVIVLPKEAYRYEEENDDGPKSDT
jgi:hypothetical protein